MELLAPPGSAERPPARASLAVLGAGIGIGLATAGAAAGVWLYLAGPPKRVEVVVGRTSLPDLRDGVPSVVASNPSASPLAGRLAAGSAAFVPALGAETRTGSIRTIPMNRAAAAASPPASGGAATSSPASAPAATTSAAPAPTEPRTDAIAALLEPAPPAVPPKPAAAPRPQAAVSPQAVVTPPSRAEAGARPDPVRPDDAAADRAALPGPLPPAAPARSVAVPKPETRPSTVQQAQTAPPQPARARPAAAAPATPSPMPPPPSAVEEDRVEVFGLKLPGFVPTGKRLKEAADQVGDAITGLPGRF